MFLHLSLPVVFPQDLLEKGMDASNFAMLGLGDIVIPGIFIALLLRFDIRCLSLSHSLTRSLSHALGVCLVSPGTAA